jgi:uncharacterized protein (TIGR02145 family)
LTDIEGNVYKTIQIGSQTWMADNLRTTKYRNGTSIPNTFVNQGAWRSLTSGAYCSYQNNTANDCPYGKLYNWYAVNDARGLAPQGWHIPTETEWDSLMTTVGGISVAGGSLKATGTTYWTNPNDGATNSSGFTALPGGFRNPSGPFQSINSSFFCWSSTESGTTNAWYYGAVNNSVAAFKNNFVTKNAGATVRCIKD